MQHLDLNCVRDKKILVLINYNYIITSGNCRAFPSLYVCFLINLHADPLFWARNLGFNDTWPLFFISISH